MYVDFINWTTLQHQVGMTYIRLSYWYHQLSKLSSWCFVVHVPMPEFADKFWFGTNHYLCLILGVTCRNIVSLLLHDSGPSLILVICITKCILIFWRIVNCTIKIFRDSVNGNNANWGKILLISQITKKQYDNHISQWKKYIG